MEDQTDILKRVKAALDELGPELDKQNDTPNPTPPPVAPTVVADSNVQKYLKSSDIYELRQELKKKSTADLWHLFNLQASKPDTGVPINAWMAAGGRALGDALAMNPDITKTLDSGGAAALIRQDLEPVLYELFIRVFPYWDRIAKEPANGLVHAYNQVSSYGDAQFMTELGTVTDDVSTYVRKTTPISVIATRRGLSLKSQYAVLQGGAGYNAEQQELRGGLLAIAHKLQKTIFQGNATVSSGTATTEDGAYDANSFDGLRRLLNTANAVNADPIKATPDNIANLVYTASTNAMQNAGNPGIMYCEPAVKQLLSAQLTDQVRFAETRVEVVPNVIVQGVNTQFGDLGLVGIPGDSVGEYLPTSASGTAWSDIYMLDESVISMPFLGSESVQVLDIPIGISGQLTHLFILFVMAGLAVKAPLFSSKIRVRTA